MDGRTERTPEQVAAAFRDHLGRHDFTGAEWVNLTVLHCRTEAYEAFCGLWLLAFGLWAAAPWWSVVVVSPTSYRALMLVFKDELWLGLTLAASGGWMLWSLWADSKAGRWLGCMAAAALTSSLAPSFLISDARSPGFLFWGIMSAGLWWSQSRIRARYVHFEGDADAHAS